MYSEIPISLAGRSLYGIGPRLTDDKDFVQELCSYEMRLDLDTAHVIHAEPFRLNPPCVECSAKLELDRFDANHRLLPDSAKRLRGVFAESVKIPWKLDDSELFAMALRGSEQVKNGETPKRNVICLDLEYSSSSREVFEIGAVDYYSGETLCDVRVRHNPANTRPAHLGNKLPLKILRHKLYEKFHLGLNAGKSPSLDISHIARLIRSIMTTGTIILNWASHKLDLQLLREMLATAGCGDFLPSDDNCIHMISLVRKMLRQIDTSDERNLLEKPMENSVATLPLSLPVIFPLIFAGLALAGRNHRAIADVLQLQLMSQYVENNCRSPETRNGGLFEYRRTCVQRSLDNYSGFIGPAMS